MAALAQDPSQGPVAEGDAEDAVWINMPEVSVNGYRRREILPTQVVI